MFNPIPTKVWNLRGFLQIQGFLDIISYWMDIKKCKLTFYIKMAKKWKIFNIFVKNGILVVFQ